MDKAFVFALLTALIWGFAPVFEKVGLSGTTDPFAGVVVRTLSIAVVAVVGLVAMGKAGAVTAIEPRSMAYIAAGGLLAGLFGQVAFYSALKWGEASVVVPVAATYPLVALVVSVAFLGEALTVTKAAGAAMVVAGVVLLK